MEILDKDTVLDQNYDETIFVPENRILTIKGQTNRLIIVKKGAKVIIEGTANRINIFGGQVIVEEKGYCDSLYCGGGSIIDISGRIHQIYILRQAELTMEPNSMAIDIYNDDSKVTIKENSYIKNYNQWGEKASCNIIGDGDHIIQKMIVNCGGKNE